MNFYRTWADTQWNLLAAFRNGWNAVARYRHRILGGGIVLWTAHSVLANNQYDAYRNWKCDDRSQSVRAAHETGTASPRLHHVCDLLRVSVRPKPSLNYSSLHNGGSVFDEFAVRLNPAYFRDSVHGLSRIDDVDVEVQLHVGADTFPYRSRLSFDFRSHYYDLAKRRSDGDETSGLTPPIRLPLTGELFRTISERIETSLYVELRWHDQVLYRQTFGVWIAPIDQWTLDDRQLGWLPSFVQPRDPVVAELTGKAAAFLQCLRDHPDCGFDGYQSYDPNGPRAQRWCGVDHQVQAIWWAMRSGTPLRYINPPPSYAEFTQRLRTPGTTLRGGFGTCVDLAIALVSCLEWVEIHPVLFLLHGHVFAGYWKDLTAHRQFRDVLTEDVPDADTENEIVDRERQQRWVSDASSYREIRGFVDRGELVPLETVDLTRGKGFQAAIADGRDYFEKPRNRSFRAMVDLVTARTQNGVTPLPLVVHDTSHPNPLRSDR